MGRRFLIIAIVVVMGLCVALGSGGGPVQAQISGSFAVELIARPDPDLGEPVEAAKFEFDFESRLELALTVSGLTFSHTTLFGTGGLQFVSLGLDVILGPFHIKDAFIFAPNLIEVDDDLDQTIVLVRPDVGALVGVPLAPFLDEWGAFPDLIGRLSPTLQGPLLFRKKLVEVVLSVGGLETRTTFLLANFGDAVTPRWEPGLIARLSGQIFGGGPRLAATAYWGARRGYECFGLCKPVERFPQGRVVEGFDLEEEVLSLEGLNLLGLQNDLYLVFDFTGVEIPRFSEAHWEALLALGPLKVHHRLRLDEDFRLRGQFLTTTVALGPGRLQVLLQDREAAFRFPVRQLTITLPLGPLRVVNTLTLHREPGSEPRGLLDVLEVAWDGGSWAAESRTAFSGTEGELRLYGQRFVLEARLGNLTLVGGASFRSHVLVQQVFALELEW